MQKLSDQLEQNWIAFLRQWDCELAREYGREHVEPMQQTLMEYEKNADLMMDAALELNRALRVFDAY